MIETKSVWAILAMAVVGVSCNSEKITEYPADVEERIANIAENFIFADMHSHPSRFHRADVETIAAEEIALYTANHMDVVVANISSDMAYSGGYVKSWTASK